LTSRALSGATLLWIGTRSYGLYLYHWPIYQIVRNTAGTKLKFHEWVLCMVATAIITEISYRYIETPIRKGHLSEWWRNRGQRSRRNEHGRAVLIGAFVATALAVFAGYGLATAELKQNEVAQSLEQSAGATCSVIEGNCGDKADSTPVLGDVESGSADVGEMPVTSIDFGAEDAQVVDAVTTTEILEGPSKLAIGDSVMLGAAEELQAAGFAVDAAESRAFVRGVDILQSLTDNSQLPEELVVHLGTNGPIDETEMSQLLDLAATVPKVVLVQNDVPRDYEASNNTLMVNEASGRSNVEVLYWDGLAAQCPGDCIYQDGYHLKTPGAEYYTALITTVLGDAALFS
jgi:hypothetical protein